MNSSKYREILTLFETLDIKTKGYMKDYFKNAPEWVYDSCSVIALDKNDIFITENSKVQNVHLLVEGFVKATDFRIQGAIYNFMWFQPVIAFGALEVLLGETTYKTTLMASTPCKMIKMPKVVYEKWVREDVNALFIESANTASHLMNQSRRERVYLFMQAVDRLAYFMINYYDQFEIDGVCQVGLTRQDLSDCTGVSSKTITRSLANLMEKGCVGKKGNKIIIGPEQYYKLSQYISDIVD
ncbi:MAG: Crp/Fnr family transcriptional regulator [bacterium]|nr:Crp/Fnr family transcriptional regulator [bacterium]